MIDWRRNQELLLQESEPFVRALVAKTRGDGDGLAAMGYCFEFGRGQWFFELCATTARHAKASLARRLAASSDASPDEFRWNSGNFDYPGTIQDHFGGWSQTWCAVLSRLDHLAEQEQQSPLVHHKVAGICCQVLADLARRGILGDWTTIDFNVAALLDDIAEVKKRDLRIRKLISPNAEPVETPGA